MGDHACEDSEAIFNRKKADIVCLGITFWLMMSLEARPRKVQEICRSFPAYTIFVEPATREELDPLLKKTKQKNMTEIYGIHSLKA
jgi:hypothetical protein